MSIRITPQSTCIHAENGINRRTLNKTYRLSYNEVRFPINWIAMTVFRKIMFWSDLDGNILLGRVFAKSIEILLIDVYSIKIDREGPTILIEFDLVGPLPDKPPPKWGKAYNTCRRP